MTKVIQDFVFELSDLAIHYGSLVAIPGLSAQCPGGAVGLLGPNGAGKSSLIKAILGLVRPVRGGAKVLGIDAVRNPIAVRRRVGYVPESAGHFPGLTGFENVAYAGQIAGMPRGEARRRAHEVLEYVGMDEERYRPAETYSTGMKQKMKIAAALIHDPDLVLLDEPTNGLDPKARREVLELIHDLGNNKGLNIVLSSHLLEDVESVCSSILVLAKGVLRASGPLSVLKERLAGSRVQLTVFGEAERFLELLKNRGFEAYASDPLSPEDCIVKLTDGQEPRVLLKMAREAGVQIRRFLPRGATLEEVFMESLVSTMVEPHGPPAADSGGGQSSTENR